MWWDLLLFAVTGLALYGLFLLACRITGFMRSRPDAPPALSLLVVVRNQAPVIEGLIRHILALHHRVPAFFELVVVDDRSGDETPGILQRLNRRHHFTLIQMDQFPGEQALETGLRFCRGEVVYCFDLTGRVRPHLVVRLIGRLLKGEKASPAGESCGITLVTKRVG
ncbi:MAG TPA: glycosyltransferase [Syntrophomonadaceae bacterium]|nr:glycosyltransferase [Syntrophomonadaceae bacterium]